MTRSMFGDQAHSKRRSSPSYGFGSSTRNQAGKVFLSTDHAKLSTPGFSPGPTVYTLHASLGTQADGRKSSSPQWVFGSSGRFSYEKNGMQIPGALHPTEPFALHWSRVGAYNAYIDFHRVAHAIERPPSCGAVRHHSPIFDGPFGVRVWGRAGRI